MEQRVLKLMQYIEKHSASNVEKSIKGIQNLTFDFNQCIRIIPDHVLLKITLSLTKLLKHRDTTLAQAVGVVLLQLIDLDFLIPKELNQSLMFGAMSAFEVTTKVDAHFSLICNILTNLVVDNSHNQELLRYNGSLQHVVCILCKNLEFEQDDENMQYFCNTINLLVAGLCIPPNNLNKKLVAETIIVQVLQLAEKWINSKDTSAMDFSLKEMLFLCREIISTSKICQNMFLNHKGFTVLHRILQNTERMQQYMEIDFPIRPLLIDPSRTIFSSLVLLLDAAVTHNNHNCSIAVNMNFQDILSQYLLSHVPRNQEASLIATLSHIWESGLATPDPKLQVELMNILACNKGVEYFLDTGILSNIVEMEDTGKEVTPFKKRKFTSGTPYPPQKKSKVEDDAVSTVHPYGASSSSDPPTPATTSSKKCGAPEPSQFANYFIGFAELIHLFRCIKVHGVNMEAVRKIYPFHRDLTSDDLYALWRAIWRN